jgi:hypothetical protein
MENKKQNPEEKSNFTRGERSADHSEKTQAVNTTHSENTTASKESTVKSTSATSESTPPPLQDQDDFKAKTMKNKQAYSGETLAGGMAAAAVAGAALGVAFGDDIKEAYANITEGSENSTDQNVTPVSVSSTNEDVGYNHQPHIDSIKYTDTDGTVYSVSLADVDGDGNTDYTSGEIIFVDGSSIGVIQSGNPLSPMFTSGLDYATPQDYTLHIDFVSHLDNISEANVYHIEAGDTLSEIALENHTSVDDIMMLNPHIENPDVIYAGDNHILPDDSNNIIQELPYEMTSISDIGSSDKVDDSMADFSTGIHTQEYHQIEWASNPDQYQELLSNTDFDSYNTPDSYLSYMGTGEFI